MKSVNPAGTSRITTLNHRISQGVSSRVNLIKNWGASMRPSRETQQPRDLHWESNMWPEKLRFSSVTGVSLFFFPLCVLTLVPASSSHGKQCAGVGINEIAAARGCRQWAESTLINGQPFCHYLRCGKAIFIIITAITQRHERASPRLDRSKGLLSFPLLQIYVFFRYFHSSPQ